MPKGTTAKEHYEKARRLRGLSIQLGDPKMRQVVMIMAIKHEAIAEELERLEADED
jgi:uncharacterized protein YicC (UPF0701 family)